MAKSRKSTAKRSGDSDSEAIWNVCPLDDWVRQETRDIRRRKFVHTTFVAGPALVQIEAKDGCRDTIPYTGRRFNAKIWRLVEGAWTHEHCCICSFCITPGINYWQDARGIEYTGLCDVCYEHVFESA